MNLLNLSILIFILIMFIFLNQFVKFYKSRCELIFLLRKIGEKQNKIEIMNKQMTIIDNITIITKPYQSNKEPITKLFDDVYKILNWRCAFWELHEQEQTVEMVQQKGMPQAYLDQLKNTINNSTLVGNHVTGRAISTKQPVIVNDWLADPRLEKLTFLSYSGNCKSLGSFPIVTKKRTYGALAAYGREINQFKLNEVQFFSIITNILAVVIENNILYSQRIK